MTNWLDTKKAPRKVSAQLPPSLVERLEGLLAFVQGSQPEATMDDLFERALSELVSGKKDARSRQMAKAWKAHEKEEAARRAELARRRVSIRPGAGAQGGGGQAGGAES